MSLVTDVRATLGASHALAWESRERPSTADHIHALVDSRIANALQTVIRGHQPASTLTFVHSARTPHVPSATWTSAISGKRTTYRGPLASLMIVSVHHRDALAPEGRAMLLQAKTSSIAHTGSLADPDERGLFSLYHDWPAFTASDDLGSPLPDQGTWNLRSPFTPARVTGRYVSIFDRQAYRWAGVSPLPVPYTPSEAYEALASASVPFPSHSPYSVGKLTSRGTSEMGVSCPDDLTDLLVGFARGRAGRSFAYAPGETLYDHWDILVNRTLEAAGFGHGDLSPVLSTGSGHGAWDDAPGLPNLQGALPIVSRLLREARDGAADSVSISRLSSFGIPAATVQAALSGTLDLPARMGRFTVATRQHIPVLVYTTFEPDMRKRRDIDPRRYATYA